MKTVLTKSPAEAAEFIKQGGVAAFPTETVYGLGANVFDEKAIAKIFKAKNRPNDNPLIAHVARAEDIDKLAAEITPDARKFIEEFFPAPLTVVLPKAVDVPYIATAGLETIGVRMPRNDVALEFLLECETPVVAPSANLSGKPSPTDWRAVYEDLNGKIDCILQGAATEIGLESTVVDCTGVVPLVLRFGAVSIEDLRKVIPETRIYMPADNAEIRSPGLKHRHYSPKARVVLVENADVRVEKPGAFIGLTETAARFAPTNRSFDLIKICSSAEDYARTVFDFFRRCDRLDIQNIYCERVAERGIGRALMDRLKRAAEM